MFVHYRTQGIILKKEDKGEADQLFTIYTKDLGKLEVLGKAIRKISSKLRSGAELFYLSEIEFIQGKTYKTLTDAILIDKFENIRSDFKRLKIALAISETLDALVLKQESDEKIWQLLNEIFQKLNNLSFVISNLSLLYYYFLWNLLSILGYQAEFYHCVLCQKKLTLENLYFSAKEGGIICKFCQKSIKLVKEIEIETVKFLRILLKKDWLTLKRLKIDTKNLNFLKTISQYFVSEIINQLNLSIKKKFRNFPN